MSGAHGPRDNGLITGINVTPLVDVVLVLLVILMVTASYIVSRAIPVDLPRAKSGEATPVTLAISLDARGAIFLDGARLEEASLREKIRTARERDLETRAIIAADGALAHRSVVHIVDLLRQEGVARFALSVQPDEIVTR